MNRRLFIPSAAPAILTGFILWATCLVSAWYIHRLQSNMSAVLSQDVASLRQAQQLEIVVRQLRFHCFIYLTDPRPERQARMESDHQHFEDALAAVQQAAATPAGRECVQAIREGYREYREELTQLLQTVGQGKPAINFGQLADSHPVAKVVDPCEDLLRLNQEAVAAASRESEHVGRQANLVMLFVGLVGPLGGLVSGLGVARTLNRSICRLSVRVQDIAQRLDQDVASVNLVADGDLQNLDRQLEHVLRRVEEVAERLQRQQRELLRAEQLAAVGQLAASVAHEVRNPLTAVKMLVELALRPRSPKSLTADDLRVIHRELVRLEQTVQNLLDFSRLPTPRRTNCDLTEVVGQAVELVRARADQQNVVVAVRGPEAPVPARVDRDQVRTVVVNLLLNALDAMPKGGTVELILDDHPGHGVSLTVQDTGAGIAPEMAGRLFTPFASTKPTGTGLGLSLSRRIVEEHGGRLTAENRPEGGARFVIQLPTHEGETRNPNSEIRNQSESSNPKAEAALSDS
jgi:signal transduction histidine kinase